MNIHVNYQSIKRIRIGVICVTVILMIIGSAGISGCDSRKESGALAGAGIGALIGQAAGGNTQATVIGGAIGAGAGYLIGNSQDKKAAEEYDMTQPTALTDTKWRVVNLLGENKPEYDTMTVVFRPDGMVVTSRHKAGAATVHMEERYRIVGDTLIINKADYMINATYKINGNEMTINCDQFRAILERIG